MNFHLPDCLQKIASARSEELRESVAALDDKRMAEFCFLMAVSDFAYETARRNPDILKIVFSENLLERDLCAWFPSELERRLADVAKGDDDALKRELRRFRTLCMFAIAWRDLACGMQLEDCVRALSALAESIIVATKNILHAWLASRYGEPIGSQSGEKQELLVIGMGKLGGSELNFSSDIDLIFCYPENGVTEGGRKELDNQSFFTKLGQQLIDALNATTSDGRVFRVDMRLRPFGDDGVLVTSFPAMEDYYVRHGRSWERYAMVKARVMGEETAAARELYALLKPFVYRRYFDFGAIDSLRKMKAMIESEIRRKGVIGNIKLGRGGIREVEFVTQVFQLIRGGRIPELQQRNLKRALDALAREEVIETGCRDRLWESYVFLRKTENALQEIADKQTQLLPEDETGKARLAAIVGFDSYDSFLGKLSAVMESVHSEFKEVVKDQCDESSEISGGWKEAWQTRLKASEIAEEAEGIARDAAEEFAEELAAFRDECGKRAIGPQGRDTLNRMMPRAIEKIAGYAHPVKLLGRFATLIRKISTRTTYLQLLDENAGVLEQVIKLCDASEKIAEQLSEYPILLDELIYPDNLYMTDSDTGRLGAELRQFLMRVPEDDIEQQIESMRQFKQIQLLRITASDLVGSLPLMRVSDYLTGLAECILSELVRIAWGELSEKHGVPPYAQSFGGMGLVIAAYGKMGGIELGYGSDLDLVFLHYNAGADEMTDGRRPVSVRQFYARLVQRIIHLFNLRTQSGVLYEIDVRLRPDGDSGLLVTTLAAFEKYQHEEAWTWEHQALVRARPVFGDQEMISEFSRIRAEVLAKKRDLAKLKDDVKSMRDKMRSHLDRSSEGAFDLKQGHGGMVDAEFLAQYLVLAHANTYPELLTKWSDNVRIMESCVECDLVSPEEAAAVKRAYLAVRDRAHKCSLMGEHRVVGAEELAKERKSVTDMWNRIIGD